MKKTEIKDCGCKGKCSCEMSEVYERVKKRYNLADNWPYWATSSELIKKELELWFEEILNGLAPKHDVNFYK